jgi:hypothetical protein
MEFKHLKYVKQGYFEHLFDSLYYSITSLKASIYFFINGLYPDLFEFNGSNEIQNLNTSITNKILKIIESNKK